MKYQNINHNCTVWLSTSGPFVWLEISGHTAGKYTDRVMGQDIWWKLEIFRDFLTETDTD